MPLYDYQCPECKATNVDIFFTLSQIKEGYGVRCLNCQVDMTRLMPAPRIQMDYAGYACPVTGDWIEGRAAHRRNLAKHGCRVLEAGEREAMNRRKADEEKEFDKKLDETIGREIASWSPAKQQRLGEELARGADCQVIRG